MLDRKITYKKYFFIKHVNIILFTYYYIITNLYLKIIIDD